MTPSSYLNINLLKVGKHAHRYFLSMLLTVLFLGVLSIQPFVTPTLLLDDTTALAQHYLEYQFQLDGEYANSVHFPKYAGAVTYLGALIWWSGGIICIFVASLLPLEATEKRYLLFAGTLTLTLAADDLFEIHGQLSYIVYFYILALVLLLFFYRNWLYRQPLLPLIVSLFFFSVSQSIDLFEMKTLSIQGNAILEEGAKLLGIVSWTFFHVFTASQSLRQKTGAASL